LFAFLSSFNYSTAYLQNNQIKDKINQLKKIKLIDILRLNENNVDKFFARYGEQERKVEEQRLLLKNSINQLELAIHNNAAEKEIQQLIQNIHHKDIALVNATIEKQKALKSLLDDQQYAKLIVFEHQFMTKLQKALIDKKKKNNNE
jgi:predicted nucleic acid-binding protein